MARLEPHRGSEGVAAPTDGHAAGPTPADRFCGQCGQRVVTGGPSIERFGEPFCSEPHAEAFAQAVRATRVRAAATALAAGGTAPPDVPGSGSPARRDWKAYLGKALCWGAPLLVVAVLLGGGTQVLGAASAFLPVLAVLACPLGMFLMMRAMAKTGRHGDGEDRGREQ